MMSEDPAKADCSASTASVPAAESSAPRGPYRVHTRAERAATWQAAMTRLAEGQRERHVAAELGLPRATLQAWRGRAADAATPAVLAAFAQTPEGVRWLHGVVMAAHFAITLLGGAGVRVVCQFLELSGLSAFVGASYGSQQALHAALEQAVVAVAQEMRRALAEEMPARDITVCEDETFHPDICLVALEPISDFIVLEQYAADRSAATWTQALQTALEGLAVNVTQQTSDEASALRCHAEQIGATHSADLFHGQHEIAKGLNGPLAQQVKHATTQVAEAEAKWARLRTGPACPRQQQASIALAHAHAALGRACARRDTARDLLREIATRYHPFDLITGQAQGVTAVRDHFTRIWTQLNQLAEAAGLSARARTHLDKAQRLTLNWLATLAVFWATLQTRVEALDLPPAIEMAVLNHLIPGLYLARVAARSTRAETRHRLTALSHALLEPVNQPAHPFQTLAAHDRLDILRVAQACADGFQRSSSAVEGRNGHLARFHHGAHRLSDRKLAALTAVHNFHARRDDGSTAAMRFFNRPHASLFTQAIARVPLPPSPRRHRAHPTAAPAIQLMAAA